MNRLEAIQAANEGVRILSVESPEFLRYGRVVGIDTEQMCRLVKENAVFPEEGHRYVTAFDAIDSCPAAGEYNNVITGQMDEQWGLCWGHNQKLNALEWHTCNEFNIGVTDLILLLAKRCEVEEGNRLDSAKVAAFYLPEGVMIEVYSDTLHFAPISLDAEGFACVVGLQRGTNEPVDQELKKDPYLRARNKWLIAHNDNQALLDKGAMPGIYGVNIEIRPIS